MIPPDHSNLDHSNLDQSNLDQSNSNSPTPNQPTPDPLDGSAIVPPPPDALAPELSPEQPLDPWAHRRGEPRVFAFLWTLYVLVAVAGSVAWLMTTGIFTASGYGPAARIMLLVLAAGVTLVWPMTRLSQASPEGSPVAACFADLIVVSLPVQLVTWPLVFLAGWPMATVVAVAMQFLAWGLLIGGVLVLALSGTPIDAPRHRGLHSRALWMLAIVGIVLAAPLIEGLAAKASATPPSWILVLSPFTALPVTTGAGVSGPTQALTQSQRLGLVVVALLGLGLWILGGRRWAGRKPTSLSDLPPGPPSA